MELYEAALDACRASRGETDLETITLRGKLAAARFVVHDRKRASREARRTRDDCRGYVDLATPRAIRALGEVAHAYEDSMGGLPHAVQLYEELLASSRTAHGEAHPRTLNLWNRLVDAHLRSGNPKRAVTRGHAWLSATAGTLGSDNPATLCASARLADALRANGDWGKAISQYQRTFHTRRRVLGEDDPQTWESCERLASARAEVGNTEEVPPLYEEVLAARTRVLGEEHPDTLATMERTALAHVAARGTDRAIELLSKAAELRYRVGR
ncbi:tetratricopeptide repeat protein [Streptomyces sp. PmtG]